MTAERAISVALVAGIPVLPFILAILGPLSAWVVFGVTIWQ